MERAADKLATRRGKVGEEAGGPTPNTKDAWPRTRRRAHGPPRPRPTSTPHLAVHKTPSVARLDRTPLAPHPASRPRLTTSPVHPPPPDSLLGLAPLPLHPPPPLQIPLQIPPRPPLFPVSPHAGGPPRTDATPRCSCVTPADTACAMHWPAEPLRSRRPLRCRVLEVISSISPCSCPPPLSFSCRHYARCVGGRTSLLRPPPTRPSRDLERRERKREERRKGERRGNREEAGMAS